MAGACSNWWTAPSAACSCRPTRPSPNSPAAGVGACVLVKNGTAKKAALAVYGKGIELKDRVASVIERGKEAAEDFVAEAKAQAQSEEAE